MKSLFESSPCRTFCTCFWNAVSCGICAYIDLRPGTPHPLFARSCAGLPPMYCSNTAHAASASLVCEETTQPVAVIVGSRRTPDHVGAGRNTVLPLVLSLSAIALYQYPYWRIAIWPSLKSAPIQFGLGSIGVWFTPSAARSYR